MKNGSTSNDYLAALKLATVRGFAAGSITKEIQLLAARHGVSFATLADGVRDCLGSSDEAVFLDHVSELRSGPSRVSTLHSEMEVGNGARRSLPPASGGGVRGRRPSGSSLGMEGQGGEANQEGVQNLSTRFRCAEKKCGREISLRGVRIHYSQVHGRVLDDKALAKVREAMAGPQETSEQRAPATKGVVCNRCGYRPSTSMVGGARWKDLAEHMNNCKGVPAKAEAKASPGGSQEPLTYPCPDCGQMCKAPGLIPHVRWRHHRVMPRAEFEAVKSGRAVDQVTA